MKTLFSHTKHAYTPRNVNLLHQMEQRAASWNQRTAVAITKWTASMWTAYLFFLLSIIGLFGLLNWLNPITFLLAGWLSQQCIQLVYLPILSVGQAVIGRHNELQAEEMYQTTMKNDHDLAQIMAHLDAQDKEIVEHATMLKDISQTQAATIALLKRMLDVLHDPLDSTDKHPAMKKEPD